MRFLLALLAAPVAAQTPVLVEQTSGTTALLQAVHALDARTAWVSGHAGTVLRTTDGGATWQLHRVPGDTTLQWRDIHAVSARRAIVMAAGNGPASRLAETDDAGATWRTAYVNADSAAFFDCMAGWPGGGAFVLSDGVGGRLPYIVTEDGRTWRDDRTRLPAALPGEGGFAASGTCAFTLDARHGWLATGNGAMPRVLRTEDGGTTWTAAEVPLLRGGASGATAVAFRDARHGVVLGGAIDGKAVGPRTAVTTDGGRTWRTAGEPTITGAVYGAAYARVRGRWLLVAVGPGGASLSRDDGASWWPLAEGPFWSVGFAPDGTGWLAGPRGRLLRLDWR